MSDWVIRHALPDDRSFIIDSWLRSYRNSPFAKRLPDDSYYSKYGHAGFVEDVVDAKDSCLAVACLPSDEAFAMGWLASTLLTPEGSYLHYVYVKQDFRRHGVATALLNWKEHMWRFATAETSAWHHLATTLRLTASYRHPYSLHREVK